MRRRWLALVAVLLALPASALAMDMAGSSPGPEVSIYYGQVSPTKIEAVAGETVHWTNASVRNHTVTADDGSYDSGTLAPNHQYARIFDSVGTYTYHCRLHPYIRGEVDVHTLLLDRPAQPAAPGHAYPLSGRAALPAGSAVAIEFNDGSGNWRQVAQTSVNLDGTFDADVTPTTSGSYRALGGNDQSPPVDLLVVDRKVSASARHAARGSLVSVDVSPASPGATVVLELYLKDRFGWWPVAQHKLGKSSRTTFTVAHRRALSARVVLTLSDGATVITASPKLRLIR
jgi:plastocyanin